jgi:hypothetical protein
MTVEFFRGGANPGMARGPGPVHVMENCFDENKIVFVGSTFFRNRAKLKQQQWCRSLILWSKFVRNPSTATRQSQNNTGETPAMISCTCEMIIKGKKKTSHI